MHQSRSGTNPDHDASSSPAAPARPARGSIFVALYSLLYWPYLLLSSAALFWVALAIFLVTAPWDRRRSLLARFTSLWGAHYLSYAPFAGVTVEGRENSPPGACVYVANHQSMVDILAAFALRLPFLWVSKVENFYAPFLGWNMMLNRYVPLRRGHLPSILRMVRTCNARLREGFSLFVFPEGTRSPDGELRPFFRGAFLIAARNQVPVVPILIEGTAEVLAKGSLCIVPRNVRVRILAPVDPAAFDHDPRRLHDEVRARMAAAQAEMRGRAG